jgi:uncharacterized membrane protein SpoIIM required for sporulation
MVLESIINPFKAEQKPLSLFFIGILYTTISLFLSLWIFEDYASLVMVFLTVVACIPLFYSTMVREEEKETQIDSEKTLLKEHAKALRFLIFLFLGITVAYIVWFLVLPQNITTNVFSVQSQTIASINKVTGDVTQLDVLSRIFLNNVKVLVFSVLFSLIYGAGAMFIIVWNASVISVAAGNFIKMQLASFMGSGGAATTGYLYATATTGLRYFVHGIPEILAYFIAALAGGILSTAIIKRRFGTKQFEKVAIDTTDLLVLSIIVLFIAALMEVYLTPLFF